MKIESGDGTTGIVISGRHLALRNVQSQHSGAYTCSGSNQHGRSVSNQINLQVLCKYLEAFKPK